MANVLFELDRLRATLQNKGLDGNTVEMIVDRARQDIDSAFQQEGGAAMDLGIEQGIEKRSADFINDLFLDPNRMALDTMSGSFEFTEPPFPMLSSLLSNAKPMKDGSGVYKVIPIGKPGKERPKVSSNIYDVQKQINAERIEAAANNYNAKVPAGSKSQAFRTATSKQPATMWVRKEQTKDFTQEVQTINKELNSSMDEIIRNIISDYEESF
jgi:hypothetical protein